jgi:Fe-S-cluster containining protein
MFRDRLISFFKFGKKDNSFDEKNPCFGCEGLSHGERIKAPCCHNPSILQLDEAEYLKHFLEFYLKSEVDCDESVDREKSDLENGHFSLVYFLYLLEACPHLNEESGKCKIQDDKPKCCKEAVPGEFGFCIL